MKKIFYSLDILLVFLLHGFILPAQNQDPRPFSDPDSLNDVFARVMDNDTWCKVNWNWNTFFWEFDFDDGEADDYFVFAQPGGMSAVRFPAATYARKVVGGEIYVGDGSFPGPFLGTSFRVIVFDDDGGYGLPGTALDSITVTVNHYHTIAFEGLNAIVTFGSFYIAIRQLESPPGAAPVGVDTDSPTHGLSYMKFGDNPWVHSDIQDFMIRAWITGIEPDSSTYQVDRFSNFDPNGSPLLGDTLQLDTTNLHFYADFEWDSLAYGWYAYGIKEHYYGGGCSEYVVSNVAGHFDTNINYPPTCFYQADTGSLPLIICPPLDINGNIPFNFLGYYVYLNGEEIDVLTQQTTYYIPDCEPPCIKTFGLTAVYDMTPFGFPGEYGESEVILSDYMIRYGLPLDFQENWNSGSFETNYWTIGTVNWIIDDQEGNPSPSAAFGFYPTQVNYSISLESYPILGDSLFSRKIYLDFDMKLDSYNSTGAEKMLVQSWNWNFQDWITLMDASNADGSLDWDHFHLDLTEHALSQVFKIRFQALGSNSLDIVSWYIDNVHVYRECDAPGDLEVYANAALEAFELTWADPAGIGPYWIHWDDSENYYEIGTGAAAEFDVAARWTPDELSQFENSILTAVAFFPKVTEASYRIRVWTGEVADTMIIDQPVLDPYIEQWNNIDLDSPVTIDITRELWVGYHVSTTTGLPAGCDDGPAIDGFGNMINFGGWHTLLELNSSLDYNWNIQAYIQPPDTAENPYLYKIYRKDVWSRDDYFFRGYSEDNYYFDDSVLIPTNTYCYQVSALYFYGGDTCESGYSNEVCEEYVKIREDKGDLPFTVYPNPASDLLMVEANEKMGLISLYSYNGRLMFRIEMTDRNYTMPIADYPEGMYLLRVETGAGLVSKKVVIMR